MPKVTPSADITTLDYSVVMDLSSPTPVITLANLSAVINAGNLKWVFEIYAPSGVPIHKGSLAVPDVNQTAWNSNFVQNTGFPMPMGVIELGVYQVIVSVTDALNKSYSLAKNIYICRPSGNTKDSKNLYGAAIHQITTKCQQAQIFVQDMTPYSYNGFTGTSVSNNFTLRFPSDDTGAEPNPFAIANFSSALIPITTSGEGYQSFQVAIVSYDYGDNVSVKIKYMGKTAFAVHCNLDLGLLGCAIKGLIDSIENGTCDDKNSAQEKLNLINPKFQLAMLGVLYPQTCVDPWALVEEIKAIGGFDCNCCSSGINAAAAISGGGALAFAVNPGGDIVASFSIAGSTVTLNIHDTTYVFAVNPGYTGSAFSITPATVGNTKTYTLNVNINTLASEVLTAISSSTGLLNQIVSMVQVNSNKVSVNPKCLSPLLGASGGACDYTFTLGLGVGQSIQLEGFTYTDPVDGDTLIPLNGFIFDQTNLAALQSAINASANALNGGTFVAAFNAGTRVLSITSAANPNALTKLTYINAGTSTAFDFSKSNCGGSGSFSVQILFQAVIDWICNVGGSAVKTGCTFNISKLASLSSAIQNVPVGGTDSLCSALGKIVDSLNSLVALVKGIREATWANIYSIYSGNIPAKIADDDYLFGRINGQGGMVSPDLIVDAILAKLAGPRKDAFCALVSKCSQATCTAVNNATLSYDSATHNLTLVITNTGALQYRVGYKSIKNTPTGNLYGPLVGVAIINATAGATTTNVFPSVVANTYVAVVVALCPSGEAAPYTTGSSTLCGVPASFSAIQSGSSFILTWGGIPVSATKVRVTRRGNDGINATNYAVGASPLTIPMPSGVSGDFTFWLQTVCDETNEWYSDMTSQVVVSVASINTCPMVVDASVTVIGQTTATFVATKPNVSVTPNAYMLRLFPHDGSNVKLTYLASALGSTVTWNITGLTPGTVYSWDIISTCAADKPGSDPFPGTQFATATGATNNSSITNSSSTDVVQPVWVALDGSMVFLSNTGQAHGVTLPFALNNYTGVSAKVRVCGFTISTCTITSNGQTFNAYGFDTDGAALFSGVTIVNGATISYS